jgi:predicted transcriptional regulator
LVAIHKAADLTQVELATQMGVAQSEISRIEGRHDMLLSTLTSYLHAAGE